MDFLRYMTRRRVVAALLGLSLLSCLLAPTGGRRLRTAAATLLAPLSHAGTSVILRVRQNVDDLTAEQLTEQQARAALEENRALRAQALAYEQIIADQSEQLRRLEFWREILPPEEQFPCALIPAAVIGGDATVYRGSRLLQPALEVRAGAAVTTLGLAVGQDKAIPPGYAVLGSTALAGRIVESGGWVARMQTVLDADFVIEAQVKRMIADPDNPRTIEDERLRIARPLQPDDPMVPVTVGGLGKEHLATRHAVPAFYNFRAGDMVVTRGDSTLPACIIIGTVSAVRPERSDPNHVWLDVTPAVDLRTLREAYVVQPWAVTVR